MFGLPSTMASTCFNAMDCLMNCFRFWAPHRRLSTPPWPDEPSPRFAGLNIFEVQLQLRLSPPMSAGVPRGRVPVPASVKALAGGGPLRAVWRNELGGLTFEI